jgi:hypothetical protein
MSANDGHSHAHIGGRMLHVHANASNRAQLMNFVCTCDHRHMKLGYQGRHRETETELFFLQLQVQAAAAAAAVILIAEVYYFSNGHIADLRCLDSDRCNLVAYRAAAAASTPASTRPDRLCSVNCNSCIGIAHVSV